MADETTGTPLDAAHRMYLAIAIALMIWSFYLFAKITADMFFGENKKTLRDILKNPVLVAWYLLLPPNMLMMFVYCIEHIRAVTSGYEIEAGGLCTFVAFFAINAIIAMNGSSIVIAYVTFRLVNDGKKPDLKIILIGNAVAWVVGLIISTIFMTGNSIGPYQGLYCCVKEEQYYGFRVALVFTTFFVSTGSQTFFYAKSYQKIKQTEGGGLQSTGGTAKKASKVIFKRGAEMVGIFYLCWSIMVINSFHAFVGRKPNIWVSALAAWMTKLMPVLHCKMMSRNLTRIKKIAVNTSAAGSQNGSSANEDDDMDIEHRVADAAANTVTLLQNVNTLTQAQQKLTGTLGSLSSQMTEGFASLGKKIEAMESAAAAKSAEVREAAPSTTLPNAETEQLQAEVAVLRRQLSEKISSAKKDNDLRAKLVMLQEENIRLMDEIRKNRRQNSAT